MVAPQPSPETESSTPTGLDLLHKFNSLQSSRVQVYKDLEAGFQQYLSQTRTPDQYESLLKEITAKFAGLSAHVRDAEQALRNEGLEVIAGLIRRVQELEKEKLETTVKYQIKKAETTFGDRDYGDEVQDLLLKSLGIVERINEMLDEIRCEMAEL